MAVSFKHAFESAKTDSTDTTLVRPSNWNAEHTVTITGPAVVGKADSGNGAATEVTILDEDNMASDSATSLATQQSIKAYADSLAGATTEAIQDIVGGMFSGNTETLVTVTYQDADGTIDVVVDEASINHDNLTGFAANEHFTQANITTVGTVTAGNVDAVVSAADLTTAGKVELATVAETNTGTDATRAVTPDGLDGWAGSAQITTLGTIVAGTWQGTTVAVDQGGTGVTTLTDGGILLGSGTGAITATAALADGEMIVGDGTTDPAIESGAALRTSIGVGTGDSPQFTGIELGHASDTTLTRDAAGELAVEGTRIAKLDGLLQDLDTLGANAADSEFLVGTGAGALAWESGQTARASLGSEWTQIDASGTIAANTTEVNFNTSIDEYTELAIICVEVEVDASASRPQFHFSTDNGSTFLNVNHITEVNTQNSIARRTAFLANGNVGLTATDAFTCVVRFMNNAQYPWVTSFFSRHQLTGWGSFMHGLIETTSTIDYVRIDPNTGNFDSGNIYLFAK